MKLYGFKAITPVLNGVVRDIRPMWMMEELGIPYNLVLLDARKEEHASQEFLKINPWGKIPVLVDDEDRVYCESAFICTHLAETAGRFIPERGSRERQLMDQLLFTAVSTLEPACGTFVSTDVFRRDNPDSPARRRFAQEVLDEQLPVWEQIFSKYPYALPRTEEFTVLDVMVASILRCLKHTDAFVRYPAVTSYLERVAARPAYQRALARHGVEDPVQESAALH